MAFFEAENKRDWESYRRFLATDVEWVSFEPPRRRIIRGRDKYLTEMKHTYEGRDSTFEIEMLLVDEERELAVAELSFEGRRSIDIFELKNGVIEREREYFDDTYWFAHMPKKVNSEGA